MKNSKLKHVAMIMDGNGRWAKSEGKPRTYGHDVGLEKIKLAANSAIRHGVETLTLFAFSTENWKRPKAEVKHLWDFPEKHFDKFLENYLKNDVKVKLIGNLDKIPSHAKKAFDEAVEKTKDCKTLTLVFAMNYGSRDEIVRSVNKLINSNKKVTEKSLNNALDTSGFADVDLLVRTSGEQRISNFLLWQIAYSEIIFVKYNWPELTDEKFDDIIEEYNKRTRTYGGLEDGK